MIKNQSVVVNTIGNWQYLSIPKEIQSLKENEVSKNNWKSAMLFDTKRNTVTKKMKFPKINASQNFEVNTIREPDTFKPFSFCRKVILLTPKY